MRRAVCIVLSLAGSLGLHAQKETLALCEDSVSELYFKMIRSAPDEQKQKLNGKLCETLERTLERKGAFDFAFDSLRKFKLLLSPPDNSFRLYSWNIEMQDGTQQYSGFIHVYNKKKKQYEVFRLNDRSEGMKNVENAACDKDYWFGASYYRIIESKYKGKKYYTLLGWDGNDRITNKKLIDVLYFDSKGNPKFGDGIFKYDRKTVKRVILEYKAGLFVSLKYDESKNRIVFDHLSPETPQLEGQYQFYGPDFSYDSFEFQKGKWIFSQEVDVHNPKKEEDKKYNTPH